MSEEDDDLRDLREWGEKIAAAENGDSEPRCVMRAFSRKEAARFIFTMQTWADLEDIQSPCLRGLPFETPEEMVAAARAFNLDLTLTKLDRAELLLVLEAMRDAVRDGFAMVLAMQPPEGFQQPTGGSRDGFGSWLPIFTCLVAEVGVSVAEARALSVGEAFALLACNRHNQGWTPKGTPYALREIGGADEEAADPENENPANEGSASC
jgi:hypothetical protein